MENVKMSVNGTKLTIEDGDWPLIIEALRLCAAMLEFESEGRSSEVLDRPI